MKKITHLFIAMLSIVTLTGCNTIDGLGKDLKKGILENKTIQGLGKDLDNLLFDNHTIQGLGKDIKTLGTKTKEMISTSETSESK